MDTGDPAQLPAARPRLPCDEMLRGLGRRLRAAGYDTATAEGGVDDRDLLARAQREGRALALDGKEP